jgi:RNA polymerase sigma-70 factor (ECF subfamily)
MTGSRGPDDAADVELLDRAAAGDKDAFGTVFERYQHVVYRFARAMTGSREAAEDVTQEVFIALIRDLRRYVPERATLGAYLYGIARNLSRDRLRRERRFLAWVSGVTLADEKCTVDPFEQMVAGETSADVRHALAQIPVRYREVVILCDLHDLSYAEAGEILHTSTGAVRSRLHRGRYLLRQRLSRSATTRVCQTARSSVRYSR